MTRERDSALQHILACYLHQDWDLDYGDWENAIKVARESNPEELITAAVDELDRILAEQHSEQDFGRFLAEASCYYLPDPETYADWLLRVRNLLHG